MVEKEPIYQIRWTNQYKKDVKLAKKRNYNISELLEVVKKLSFGLPLEEKYKDHALEGNWKNHRELHIRPDWLLIYQIKDDILILELSRTGTHSDLFKNNFVDCLKKYATIANKHKLSKQEKNPKPPSFRTRFGILHQYFSDISKLKILCVLLISRKKIKPVNSVSCEQIRVVKTHLLSLILKP